MRVFNRLLIFALGVALAGLGFIATVEAVWTGLGYRLLWFPGQAWLRTLQSTAWSTRSVEIGAAIAAFVGMVLLVAEIRPWRKRLVRTGADGDGVWLLHRRSTEQLLSRRVARQVVSGPIKARLSIGAQRWKLSLRTHVAASNAPALRAAAEAELARLGAPARSKVFVHTTRNKGF